MGLTAGCRKCYLLALLLLVGVASRAQDTKKEITPTMGFVVSHEEFGLADPKTTFGVHIGL